jgi:hypothetical protein
LPRPRPLSRTRPLPRSSPAPLRSNRSSSPGHSLLRLHRPKQHLGPALPWHSTSARQQPGPVSLTRRSLRAGSPC